MLVAVMLFAFTACNSGNENNAANEAEDMEMGEGMNGQHMEGMDMGQQQGTATTNVPVLNNYLDIKNALVKDNFDQAKQAAADFQNTLEETDEISATQKKELKQSAGKVAQAKDIAAMREQFSDLSQQLYQVVQANDDLSDKTLYWQHCPMAMNNKGANWLSLEEKVQNPYMGQKMPGCGSVQETVN
ncbi:MAG: DUF3347 domain-containing protein [Bacteroidetes bacterium]|nr:DUF3347 domain-containing protein [Bacteroidota bacterium]